MVVCAVMAADFYSHFYCLKRVNVHMMANVVLVRYIEKGVEKVHFPLRKFHSFVNIRASPLTLYFTLLDDWQVAIIPSGDSSEIPRYVAASSLPDAERVLKSSGLRKVPSCLRRYCRLIQMPPG